MKGPGLKLWIFASFLLLFSLTGKAQEEVKESSCAQKLRLAQEQYEAGQIEAVPGLLHNCLQNGFTREERIQAYKLLINSYIFDDNLSRAEYYMLEFLRRYPEYKVVDTDPYEFVNLLEQFNNNPRGSLGINLGGNLSLVRVLEPFSLAPTESSTGEYKIAGPGFHGGFFYNLNLGSRIELSFEPMFVQNTFRYVSQPFPYTRIESKEVQRRVDIPLTTVIIFPADKINFYSRFGVKGSYLLYGYNDVVRYYENTGDVPYEPVTGPSLELDDEREEYNLWAVVGGGIRYKIPRAYFFLDLRYNIGLMDQVNGASRNNGADERMWLYYLDRNSFVIDEFSFTIGIAKTIYNPRRKNDRKR